MNRCQSPNPACCAGLVSTNKRRYRQDGYDLDLTYITPRIIAMGFPCDGLSSVYRNPVDQVWRLLEAQHGSHYKVYNLCIERGYDDAIFGGRVLRMPMYDGQAPPLHLMLCVCRDAAAWLEADPANVVLVHCKAGKGRTGAVVCALLMALDDQLGPASLESTLALWAKQRTTDGKGLTIPSQRRFVSYFHEMLLGATASASAAVPQTASTGATAGCKEVHKDGRSTACETLQVVVAAAAASAPSLAPPPAAASPGVPNGACPPSLEANGAANAPGNSSTNTSNMDAVQPPLAVVQQSAPRPADVTPARLQLAEVPCRLVRIVCLRFRGLPLSLLEDCTASIWWRPTGHYEPLALCHVQTRSCCAGCTGSSKPTLEAASEGADWIIYVCGNSSRGGEGDGRTKTQTELIINLSRLPPPPPPPPPAPLPFAAPPPLPPPKTATPQLSPGLAPTAPTADTSIRQSVRQVTAAGPDSGTNHVGGGCPGACGAAGSPPSQSPQPSQPCQPSRGPVVAGDIKIQLFRGCIDNPRHDVFKGRVSQFSVWLNTAFMQPHTTKLELGRKELDKLSKPLRRWPGAVGLTIEYEQELAAAQ